MNDIYDVMEICLREIENGADIESVLARYPDLAGDLRPVLKGSILARSKVISHPSPELIRRGRSKLLQHAFEMREIKTARRRRMIPLFHRLAISLSLTALFLISGTGLVGASSSALPGENLYPVKLTWENLRLFLTFNHESRDLLETEFEDERLQEINDLFAEAKHAPIQFTGVFMELNGKTFVSGIRIVILDTTTLPADKLQNGAAVIVIGRTNAEGFVEVESIKLLPVGTIVPTGEPPEIESEQNQNENEIDNGKRNENVNDNGNDNGSGDSNSNESINNNGNSDGSSNGDGSSGNGGDSGSGGDGGGEDGSGGGGGGGGEDGSGGGGGED
jgi:hypothetical protein